MLDTSVAIKWIQENYGYEVVTLTADLGNVSDLPAIKQRAIDVGAVAAHVADVRSEFVTDFVFPALRANAMYQGAYPLATALGRPLIARLMVEAARKEGASAVAHGCTGKGNDQVRLAVSVGALAPDLKVIAPAPTCADVVASGGVKLYLILEYVAINVLQIIEMFLHLYHHYQI